MGESIQHCIDMVTLRSFILAFVLVTLGCVFAQGAALDADDRTGNFVQCFQTCRAANFASTASCTCGTNTFTCNQIFPLGSALLGGTVPNPMIANEKLNKLCKSIY